MLPIESSSRFRLGKAISYLIVKYVIFNQPESIYILQITTL